MATESILQMNLIMIKYLLKSKFVTENWIKSPLGDSHPREWKNHSLKKSMLMIERGAHD